MLLPRQGLQETPVPSLGREGPLEKEMATHSVFFPGEVHGKRSLAGYSPWGCREAKGPSTPECHSMTKLAVG